MDVHCWVELRLQPDKVHGEKNHLEKPSMGRAGEVREWAEAVNCESRKQSSFLMGPSVGQRDWSLKTVVSRPGWTSESLLGLV